jgi:hypothetical protein
MSEWFSQQAEIAISFILGVLGAGTRIVIGYDRGEKQNRFRVFATFMVGSVLAATSTKAAVVYFGLPIMAAGGISFLIGLFGLGLVYNALDGRVPFITKGSLK